MLAVVCSCGKKLGLRDEWAGRQVKCPGCGELLFAPTFSSSAAGLARRGNGPAPSVAIDDLDATAQAVPALRQRWGMVHRGLSELQGYAIIALLGLCLWAIYADLDRPTATRWEYRIVAPSDGTFDVEIDRLGRVGWELVFARRAQGSAGAMEYEMIFKRPKR